MALLSRLTMLGAARKYARNNSRQVHGAIDKVADAVKGRTPTQHAGKVDGVSSAIKRVATGSSSPTRSTRGRRR